MHLRVLFGPSQKRVCQDDSFFAFSGCATMCSFLLQFQVVLCQLSRNFI